MDGTIQNFRHEARKNIDQAREDLATASEALTGQPGLSKTEQIERLTKAATACGKAADRTVLARHAAYKARQTAQSRPDTKPGATAYGRENGRDWLRVEADRDSNGAVLVYIVADAEVYQQEEQAYVCMNGYPARKFRLRHPGNGKRVFVAAFTGCDPAVKSSVVNVWGLRALNGRSITAQITDRNADLEKACQGLMGRDERGKFTPEDGQSLSALRHAASDKIGEVSNPLYQARRVLKGQPGLSLEQQAENLRKARESVENVNIDALDEAEAKLREAEKVVESRKQAESRKASAEFGLVGTPTVSEGGTLPGMVTLTITDEDLAALRELTAFLGKFLRA